MLEFSQPMSRTSNHEATKDTKERKEIHSNHQGTKTPRKTRRSRYQELTLRLRGEKFGFSMGISGRGAEPEVSELRGAGLGRSEGKGSSEQAVRESLFGV